MQECFKGHRVHSDPLMRIRMALLALGLACLAMVSVSLICVITYDFWPQCICHYLLPKEAIVGPPAKHQERMHPL